MRMLLAALLIVATDASAQSLWTSDGGAGLRISRDIAVSITLAPAPDNGVAVLWVQRPVSNVYSVRVQKLDSLGRETWDGGIEIGQDPSSVTQVGLASNSDGGLWAGWGSSGGVNVPVAQALSPTGLALWTAGGVTLDAVNARWVRMVADPGRGAWMMYRATTGASDLTVVPLSTTPPGLNPFVRAGTTADTQFRLATVVLADGSIVVATGAGNSVRAQVITRAGQVRYPGGLKLSNAEPRSFDMVRGDDDQPIIIWEEGSTPQVHAQKLLLDGGLAWNADGGVVVGTSNLTGYNYSVQPSAATDGDGGAVIVWHGLSGVDSIFAQRIGSNGALLWSQAPPVVVGRTKTDGWARVARDSAGKYVVIWPRDLGVPYRQFAMRLDNNGQEQWTSTGTLLDGPGVEWARFQSGQTTYANSPDEIVMMAHGDGMVIAETHANVANLHRLRPDGTLGGMGGAVPADAGLDAGASDSGVDSGVVDAGPFDAGVVDSGIDAGMDADSGVADAGAGSTDSGMTDSGLADGGSNTNTHTNTASDSKTSTSCGCGASPGSLLSVEMLALLFAARRRKETFNRSR